MYCEHYITCTTWDANFGIYRWIIPNWQFTKTILPLYHRNCVSLFSSWRSWDCNIFKNRNTCMIVNKTTFYDSLSIKYKWTLIWQFRRQLPTNQIMWTLATTHHFSSSTMKKIKYRIKAYERYLKKCEIILTRKPATCFMLRIIIYMYRGYDMVEHY